MGFPAPSTLSEAPACTCLSGLVGAGVRRLASTAEAEKRDGDNHVVHVRKAQKSLTPSRKVCHLREALQARRSENGVAEPCVLSSDERPDAILIQRICRVQQSSDVELPPAGRRVPRQAAAKMWVSSRRRAFFWTRTRAGNIPSGGDVQCKTKKKDSPCESTMLAVCSTFASIPARSRTLFRRRGFSVSAGAWLARWEAAASLGASH